MPPWHDGRLAVLDLETTSADPEVARIVTAAIGHVGGGLPTDLETLVVAVDEEIPAEATAIHGWTTERARNEGQPLADVLGAIYDRLGRVRREGQALVVFNGPYDLSAIDRETRRVSLTGSTASAAEGLLQALRVVDPLVLDRHLDRFRAGKRNLVALCEHYRADLDGAHQASADALSAGRLAWRIAKSGRVIRNPRSTAEAEDYERLQEEWERVRNDLRALHEAQVRWYRQQAVGLRRYFARGNEKKGVPPQPDRIVEDDWPLRPFRTVQLALGT